MAFSAVIREMYCPKCKENFEEGSRRFCPTDGTRLISEEVEPHGVKNQGGIFADLLPKPKKDEGSHGINADAQKFVVTEPTIDLFQDEPAVKEKSEPFFEFSDIEPEFMNETNFAAAQQESYAEPKPFGRKVNLNEIPAGHVDLGDTTRTASIFADFNADEPESFVGRTVKGRYQVTEFLGGDESGLAYLADDKIVDDKMVLVRILLEDDSDEIMSSILAEERVSLSHLTHPDIARLIDSGEFTNGTQFLITEYTDSLSVRDILGIHGRFDEQRAARVIRQASYALNEAHQEGIIHRDIRPENLILATAEGEAEQTKLVNFGASNGEPNPRNAAYKAHEVLDGRITTVSSDIFSLAVVAYEMLTGNMPFRGATAKEIVKEQYAGLTEHPSAIRPELPRAVDEVLDKALSFNTADRYVKTRDFGDAFHNALTEAVKEEEEKREKGEEATDDDTAVSPLPLFTSSLPLPVAPIPAILAVAEAKTAEIENKVQILKPLDTRAAATVVEPAWKNRSPEPPQVETSRAKLIGGVGLLILLGLLAFGWFYLVNRPAEPGLSTETDQASPQAANEPAASPITSDIEVPPLPRNISQPPNTDFYQNNKQNLKGDLLRNFVGFSIYYPKDWKVNGPQESASVNARGKFLDISKSNADGKLKEQMLVSYYTSKGTFKDDAEKFPQMVKETNETLNKLLPGYQMVSEGEKRINGGWRAYEVKFQGGATSDKGEKLIVWGRRLFIPAARPGVRDGFEITMLATSLADEVRSVDDVGLRGELAAILDTFEPGQNF